MYTVTFHYSDKTTLDYTCSTLPEALFMVHQYGNSENDIVILYVPALDSVAAELIYDSTNVTTQD